MRVPLYPQDLKPGRGFKRIAKCIKRDWQGATPICLSHAQNLLARCLGYESYHEVLKAAESLVHPLPCPPLQNVWSNSMATIHNEIMPNHLPMGLDMGALITGIKAWPLLTLTAYRHQYGDAAYEAVTKDVERTWYAETFAYINSLSPKPRPVE